MTVKSSNVFPKAAMHVLFVIPRFAVPGQYYPFPIGLASVYAFLKRNGVSVSCLNLNHESGNNTYTLLDRAFSKHHVDMVCTGGMYPHWKLISDILVSSKRLNPEVITVAGGPFITADPEVALQHLPIDYGVIGEGEYSLLELLKTLQCGGRQDTVKGLAFKNSDGRLVLTEARSEIADLDALPIPEYHAFGFRDMVGNIKYAQQCTILETFDEVRFAEVLGSRSCPFSCTFCYHPLGKKYRQRSLDHIFREIDYLTTTYGVNVVQFVDELFSSDQHRMLAFAERIKPYGIKWMVQFRVSDVRLEILQKMISAGLIYTGLGIESMNDSILKSMQKHTTKAEIVAALDITRQLQLFCSGNIILGDPADTLETVNESITWWKNNPLSNVTLGFILAIPDAPVYRYALKKGIIKNKFSHIRTLPLVNLTKMSDRQYYNLVLKVRWWNIMYTYMKPGTLISTRRLEECHGDKHFYKLQLLCPLCGKEQTYKKFIARSSPNAVVVCSHCFGYFKISQKKAFSDDYSHMSVATSILNDMAQTYLLRFSIYRNYSHAVRQALGRVKRLLIHMANGQLPAEAGLREL